MCNATDRRLLENNSDPSIVMLASSICALVFDLTSEKNLLKRTEFNHSTLEGLSQLFIRSLGQVSLMSHF
ncbi:hypothetical protein KSP39_PZI004908 [Platanthera zijinensis]|uniref:Uncharacterized protein n=1 Tax=Platanthera zijinensis TaxID=2320716 RepID=A0AAP0BY62_9ASPA